jgi:hypothetical protein
MATLPDVPAAFAAGTLFELPGAPDERRRAAGPFRGTGLPDDVRAEMDNAFGYGGPEDELTEREVDELYVREMERRDREQERRDREAAAAVLAADAAAEAKIDPGACAAGAADADPLAIGGRASSAADPEPVPPSPGRTIRPGHFSRYPDVLVVALIAAAADDHPTLLELGYTSSQQLKSAYLREASHDLLRRLALVGLSVTTVG